jgi:hypothetical protein
MSQPRYRLICVAPEVPDMGSTDDLDEAIVCVGSDYYGSHFEIYDTETGRYETPQCAEEVDAAKTRLEART